MGRAIDLIVLCAQMNEHFSFMYAELCRKITDKWSSGTADEVSELVSGSDRLVLRRMRGERGGGCAYVRDRRRGRKR